MHANAGVFLFFVDFQREKSASVARGGFSDEEGDVPRKRRFLAVGDLFVLRVFRFDLECEVDWSRKVRRKIC